MSWLIQTAASLGLFYIAFILFLRPVPFFNTNRFFILASIIFSFAFPHINLQLPANFINYSILIPGATIAETARISSQADNASLWTPLRILETVYISVAIIIAIRLFINFAQIYLIILSNPVRKYNRSHIVNIKSEQAPFSFFNYVFINESLYSDREREKIIEHELVHIRQLHTLDHLFLEILTALQWFNPFAWLLRRSMIEIHEYIADEEVLKRGTSIAFYQSLLVNVNIGNMFRAPASHFYSSLTKNRIRMMSVLKPSSLKRIRAAVLLPLIALLVFMCAKTDDHPNDLTGENPVQFEPFIENSADEVTETFYIVEEMPDFLGGGQTAFRNYIAENLRYPRSAAEMGIEGQVFVQFVVKSDGYVDNVTVVRSIDPDLDSEAVRVVNSSPRWSPGKQRGIPVNVAFTFPINFILQQP